MDTQTDDAVARATHDDGALEVEEIVRRYLDGVTRLRVALLGLDAEQVRAHPLEGKWSTLEVLAHLSDADQFLADRIKRTLAEERPLLVAVDETAYAASLCYSDRDLDEELQLIELTRAQVARILRGQPAEAWQRVGVHSRNGLLTVRQLVMHASNHLEHHLAAVHAKRQALGVGG